MLQLDTIRLIKKSIRRFFSLLMIVLIGVGFMMGLLSTRPIMEKSVDDYDDAMRLQDLQIYSSYGFDEADVRAVREAEFVDEVFASRFVDCYAEAPDGTVSVVRAEEADRRVNRYELVSGRLPQAADECLFLSSGTAEEHYPLGSKVKLYLEDEDLTEKLKKTEYTVVGTVKSPAYLAFTLGTGTMKNLDLDTALYLPNENFYFEYYTSIYLTVKDAAPLDSFSSEYDVFIDDARGEAEALAIRQQDQLKGRLIDEYSAEIAKGEAELEKQKQEGQEKLDAARKELDDANIQLVSSRTQLESLNAALSEAEARQSAMVSQVNGTTGRSMNRIAQIEEEDPEKREFTEIFAQLTADYGTYNALKQMRDAVPESTSADALATARAELASLEEQIAELSTEAQEIRDEMAGLPARLQEAQARLAEAQARLAEAEAAAGLEWPDAGQPGDATGDSDGNSDGAGQPGEGQTAEDVGGSSAGSGEAGESDDQQAGQAGTSGSGNQQAEEARQEAEEAVSEAEALIDELTARQEEIAERLPEVETELAQLEAQAGIYRRLVESYEQLEKQAQTQTLDERIREIEEHYDGDPQATYLEYSKLAQDKLLNDTMQQEIKLVDGAVSRIRGEIESAVAEIDSGTAALEAGELEYRRGEIEFNVEIEKAEAEIRKAYQELEELPDAKWTILDRSSHYSSYLYKNNAAQMGAIGIALPVLFYLVAALVCMTTMTRLVDEQRGQIGVFRALGFSRARVAWKYVVYALLATLIGTVLGIGFGMMLFPSVIYRTWRLMYDLPHMEFFMPLRFMLICFLAFAVLMALVTWFVVQKTLAEVPSQLLRPKAPKSARRIFLERFTGLWNHISFTGKITARNLMRYKARFIMTVIGVAGCTGLLVVGWGIKDSISDVVAIQYGEIFNYNYIVSFEEKANVDELMAPLQADLDNEYVAPMLTYSSRVYLGSDEPTANIVCMNARDCNDVYHLHLTDRQTELKLKNSGVIVSQKFAKNNGIHKGDSITIESAHGIKADVKVSAICEMYFQHYIFISDEYYQTMFQETPNSNNIAVKNETGEANFSAIEKVPGFVSVVDFSAMIEQFNIMLQALDFIILVVILTAGSLAFVVLINLTQVNISERIREIATLKVLGFRTTEINSYIFKEIFLLSLIGGLVGLPLGVIEHSFIMNVINMEMIMFGKEIKAVSFLMAYGVTLLFTAIVLLLMRRPLRKVEMVESLKSVE